MYEPGAELPDKLTTEGDFFKSLSFLKNHYQLDLTSYRKLPYPYNILMAERELNAKLKTKNRYRELHIVAQDDNLTTLRVKESFNREFSLYYIPVMPLYQMWQKPEHQACAELLTAVCAYLYIDAGLSYYRDEDTYMFYNYEILTDWVEDDKDEMDGDDYQIQKTALDNAISFGDFIQSKMMAIGFRQSLDSLIANFEAISPFEKDSLAIAKNAWDLWQAFPAKNLYGNANNPALTNDADEDDDYYADNNFVGMDEHIGFVGSVTDVNSDTLFRMVNDDFNERPSFQEPEIVTVFNEPLQKYSDQLDFDHQLMEVITDLCTLFYNKP